LVRASQRSSAAQQYSRTTLTLSVRRI
jgi:hypothetical protein